MTALLGELGTGWAQGSGWDQGSRWAQGSGWAHCPGWVQNLLFACAGARIPCRCLGWQCQTMSQPMIGCVTLA